MTAIPHAAQALTSALDRFELASVRVLEAVTGAEDGNLSAALVDLSTAKTQAKAGVMVIRFADEMWDALLDIGRETQRP
jgi:hypothetical protein